MELIRLVTFPHLTIQNFCVLEKCKDDKTYDQNQQNDLTSAYLGPQIWSDMLLSDDLKLEPVDLDELLDTTGLEDEVRALSITVIKTTRVWSKKF